MNKVRELFDAAVGQLADARAASVNSHPQYQQRIQRLFSTVNALTAFGHDAADNRTHLDGYDPTCDLCNERKSR